MQQSGYEMVIGLEVHVELKTQTKIFCGCGTRFDAPPNTQVCPVCMGLPGALPVLNATAVEYAAMAGLATNCHIAGDARFDRKHYFYPDLPKAYQISQYDHPLCLGGWLDIETGGGARRIGITRIHMEEDAGKLTHGEDGLTRVDLNRCGVPLIELVTEPDMRTAEEARAFLQKLRAILLAIGVSDVRMNEGSLRCDVNLSVRRQGETALGTRTEMKNLNSFSNTVRAIESEFRRQVEAVARGEAIVQETRRFDAATGSTHAMRSKEDADDYRYFPDPDLPPVHLTAEEIEALRRRLPELPDAMAARLSSAHGLTRYEAATLCAQPHLRAAFDAAVGGARQPQRLWTLLMGEIARMLPEEEAVPFAPDDLAALSNLISDEVIHMGAAGHVLDAMRKEGETPQAAVDRLGLAQISDRAALAGAVAQVLAENEALVGRYLGGKQSIAQVLMGKVMGITRGRANPAIAMALLQAALDKLKKD